MKTAIIIPALNPDHSLLTLVKNLQRRNESEIIIVDDGSDGICQSIFGQLEYGMHCTVIHHDISRGKGTALKTGIRAAIQSYPGLQGIVTADADGQHTAEDIIRISNALSIHSDSIILGTRDLYADNVPFKNRWGNRITASVFRLCTHIRCSDTLTGLRGIPVQYAEFCLSIPGNRYEYEMNMLIAAAKESIPFVSIPISTIYEGKNRLSHFYPVKDSAIIYYNIFRPFIKFSLSSVVCAAADLTVFSFLIGGALPGLSFTGLLWPTVIARLISSALNFTINKNWSFASRGNGAKQALMYFVLFCVKMFLSWECVTLLSVFAVNLTLLKAVTDAVLFFFSYVIQKNIIFKMRGIDPPAELGGAESRRII